MLFRRILNNRFDCGTLSWRGLGRRAAHNHLSHQMACSVVRAHDRGDASRLHSGSHGSRRVRKHTENNQTKQHDFVSNYSLIYHPIARVIRRT